MKNRIASLFLVFALLMSLCTFAVARDNPITVQSGGAERFTDVPASHWAYDYIDKVVGSGLFKGKTDTTFEPSNAMTRSQFVLVMARMEGRSDLEGQYTVTKFPDVAPTRLAAGPIAWASEDAQGYVRGFGDGTFKPDSPITRGQFAALIHRYIISKRYVNLDVVDPEPAQFTDASSVSPAFTEDVEYARVHGLLTGYSDGTVRASNPITRAAIAAILARFLDLVTESGYIPLVDGPDNGDTGDTGDTGEEPIETPTEYPDITLIEKNGTHGTTSIVSVLRNGVQVDPDDLQEGDVVTVYHEPDKGYTVSIRVKDSKNKSVKPVTTKGYTSTFKLPKNLPVTITVTYTKTSSGGGGGGSSGGGGYTASYYLNVTANAVPVEGGTVYLTQSVPSTLPTAAITATASSAFTSIYENVAGFAVFVPNTGYHFVNATSPTMTFTDASYKPVTLTKADGTTQPATYVSVSGTGSIVQANAPTVSVTGNFAAGGNVPTGQKTWTINATGEGAYFNVAKEQQTAAVTAETQVAELNFGAVSAASESVYLAVTPRKDFTFADTNTLPTAEGATVELVSPTTATATDTLRVYKITKSTFTDGANTTTVSMTLPMKDGVDATDYTYNVTVKTFLGTKELTEADTDLPVRASADKVKATMKSVANPATEGVVTVTAPVNDTKGVGDGYKVKSVTVSKVTDMERKNLATPETITSTETTGDTANTYTFDMPGGNVEVVVTYETVADEALTYSLDVELKGSGSVALNVAGETTQVSGTNETKTITISKPTKKSEYADLYQGRDDFKLPVYLTGTPVAAKGYKYENKLDGASVLDTDEVGDKYFVLEPGTAKKVTVTFDQIVSYGYNLTIIGDGTVTGSFNGSDFSYKGNANAPQTYTSGLIVTDNRTLTLNAPTNLPAGYVADKPVVDGVEGNYGSISLNLGALTEIVVDIHKQDRAVIPFTVSATGGGSVVVFAESGKVGTSYSGNQLTNLVASDSDATVSSGGTKTYYAYEDAVITLDPQTTDTVKVESITVTANGKNLTDAMAKYGFSFQLKTDTTANVKFGTLDAYSVLLKAPYSSSGLRSESTKIASTAKLEDVLYSLNDGKQAGASTNSSTQIKNELGMAPSNLNKIVEYYLTNPVATSKKTDGKVTGSVVLQETLADAIQSNISTMVPSVVDAKKADIQKDTTTVTTPLKDAMETKQATYDNVNAETATGSVKSTIVKAVLDSNATLKQQFDAGEIKESDFTVMVKVTPILSEAKETAYSGLSLTGKSVQKQLERFVSDYLGKIQIDPSYNYKALTPEITVTTKDVNGAPEITVSAMVSTSSGWPTLDSSLKMSNYVDQLNVWVVAAVDSITVKGNAVTTLPNPDAYSVSQFTSGNDTTSAIKTQLDEVDRKVAETWDTEFGKLLEGGKLSIDMSTVLTKELLDGVVDEILNAPATTLTERVSSLGDGKITRSAFMNLYHDFVVVNSEDTSKLLSLKTKGSESTYLVIGKIDSATKSLVLTLDFEKILRDGHYQSGTPAAADQVPYEQLMDLVMALRNGISEDMRTNSRDGQTSQTVIASLIENQITSRRGILKVTKWGTEKTNFTDVERKEIANLFAELLMNSETSYTMQQVWQKMEENGYRSVEYSVTLDANKRAKLDSIVESFYGGLGQSTSNKKMDVGFKVEQGLK